MEKPVALSGFELVYVGVDSMDAIMETRANTFVGVATRMGWGKYGPSVAAGLLIRVPDHVHVQHPAGGSGLTCGNRRNGHARRERLSGTRLCTAGIVCR